MQPRHELIYHGIFSHAAPYHGQPPSGGSSTIHPPLGIFEKWLRGEVAEGDTPQQMAWLEKTLKGMARV